MDLSAYSFERVQSGDSWDEFVESSPQGTVFGQAEYLNSSGHVPSLWYCLKNSEIKGGVALLESPDGVSSVHTGFVVYNGLMFAPASPKQNTAQRFSEEFRVTSVIVRELAKRYRTIEMCVHYAFIDLRPFLWHNYGEEGPHFETKIRYTCVLSLEGACEENLNRNALYLGCNKSRRQEIRYAIRDGIETQVSYDPGLFETLYRRTFSSQGIELPQEQIARILDVIERLHDSGRLRMYVTRAADSQVGSIAVFGTDSKRAYYLYGGNDPELRGGHTGSAVLWSAFKDLARLGFQEVDLEGINSPRRGYFKLSFGGNIKPYHFLSLTTE